MGLGLVDVVNSALTTLGEQPILSIDDNTPSAIAAKTKSPLIIRDVLKSCDWNCARKTAQLARISTAPSYSRFAYVYQLPTDPECLRVIGISLDGQQFITVDSYYNDYNNPPESVYEIDGDKLYYDGETCVIKYTGLIDVSVMDIGCVRVFEAALAYELGYNIAASASMYQILENEYKKRLRKARFLNGLERNPQRPDGDAIRVRHNTGLNLQEAEE